MLHYALPAVSENLSAHGTRVEKSVEPPLIPNFHKPIIIYFPKIQYYLYLEKTKRKLKDI